MKRDVVHTMDGSGIRLVRDPGPGGWGVAYVEGNRSLVLPVFPASRHLPLPSAQLWREVMPPFVRDRRDEVLPRLVSFCREGGTLIPVEADRRGQIGRILYIEAEPYRLEYHGNPGNPAYTGEARAAYEDSRQTV